MQVLRLIAFPFSLIYALVVYLRNLMYDWGVFKSTSFKTPIVTIGNLSVGGTGKTPMVEFLIRMLKNDVKIAVLSRGYKRKTTGYLLAKETTTVEELGDEPYQIFSKFKEVSLAVDANRKNGIIKLQNEVQPDIILLDDAFQHRKVKPNYSILLTTFNNLYVKDWYLPTGNLRDSKKEANRANTIVVTKCPEHISDLDKKKAIGLLKPKVHQTVLFSKLSYGDFLIGEQQRLPLSSLKEEHFSLVTAIANPEPLLYFLRSMGASFDHFKYNDHHFFTDREISDFSKNALILTTEKDFTKLKGRCSFLYYLEVQHEFLDDGQEKLKHDLTNLTSGSRSLS